MGKKMEKGKLDKKTKEKQIRKLILKLELVTLLHEGKKETGKMKKENYTRKQKKNKYGNLYYNYTLPLREK